MQGEMKKMISFAAAIILLILGYIFYGKLAEKIFSPDDRKTPALKMHDGVDFVPMKKWKAFLVQLLNIAGTGPIFGALMGAVFGPSVFLWIVFGSVLGGAVHDYFTGMISERNGGASMAELSGKYLGRSSKYAMRAFSVVLLILVGTVFVTSPASLLAELTPDFLNADLWTAAILIYYVLATMMPIDKIIGRMYPIFGITLIVMALGIIGGVIFGGYEIPDITLKNIHPDKLPIWPYMFVTVACGAISGFHATQSPLIAKCITHEKQGKNIFYGAMITEAVIALIWAAAGLSYYKADGSLNSALANLGQSSVVYNISKGLLGRIGGILAVIGVVICPITSGDTAFRGARIILAETTGLKQNKIKNRLILTVPLLGIGAILTQIDFNVLWRYFSWSNQTLAMISLWCISAYLIQNKKNYSFLISAIPASFMTAVSITYILMAPEGLNISSAAAYPIGIISAAAAFVWCVMRFRLTG